MFIKGKALGLVSGVITIVISSSLFILISFFGGLLLEQQFKFKLFEYLSLNGITFLNFENFYQKFIFIMENSRYVFLLSTFIGLVSLILLLIIDRKNVKLIAITFIFFSILRLLCLDVISFILYLISSIKLLKNEFPIEHTPITQEETIEKGFFIKKFHYFLFSHLLISLILIVLDFKMIGLVANLLGLVYILITLFRYYLKTKTWIIKINKYFLIFLMIIFYVDVDFAKTEINSFYSFTILLFNFIMIFIAYALKYELDLQKSSTKASEIFRKVWYKTIDINNKINIFLILPYIALAFYVKGNIGLVTSSLLFILNLLFINGFIYVYTKKLTFNVDEIPSNEESQY